MSVLDDYLPSRLDVILNAHFEALALTALAELQLTR
jgi:hypothetical protein